MFKKLIFLFVLSINLISCQFTETLQLNEDGSGRMAIVMDMSEFMAMGGDMMKDSTTKLDTIISMKSFLEEKKDSISQLSEEKQMQLKKLESYHIHTLTDAEKGEMFINMYTDFTSIEEANDIFNGLGQTKSLMPNMGNQDAMNKKGDVEENEILGVSYSYKNKKFIRDAYIKDVEKHRKEVDSLKGIETIMSTIKYKLKYTFPSKIVKSSIENAKYSLDGKTIEVEASFTEYFKNPDILDLEIELEK